MAMPLPAFFIGLLSPTASLQGFVTMGLTRDDVIAAYGAPKSSTQMDAKEILVYPGGRVVLEKDW